MDNDLMARRLRPPSEPAPASQSQQMMPYPDPAMLQQDQFSWQADDGAGPDPLAPAQDVWKPASAPVPFAPPPPPLPVEPWPPAQTQSAPFVPPTTNFPTAPPASGPPQIAQFATPPSPAAFPPASGPPQPIPTQPTPAPFAPQAQSAQPQTTAPFAWPTAREQAPWDRPTEYPTPTDAVDPDQPAWDRPSPTDWIDPEQVDDRTPDMFAAHADRYTGQVAATAATAPAAQSPVMSPPRQQPEVVEQPRSSEPNAADPYDAYAPVLGDIAVPASRPWPETNGHDHGRNAPTVAAIAAPTPAAAPIEFSADVAEPPSGPAHDVGPAVGSTFTLNEPIEGPPTWAMNGPAVTVRVPIPPSGMREGGLGPTPPSGLFDDVTVVEARLVAPDPQTALPGPNSPVEDGTEEPAPRQSVSLYSNAPPTPLVVRIELAFVDGSKRVVSAAETARRVGPVEQTDESVEGADLETEKFMPRHPAFEPRGPRQQEIYDIPAPPQSLYEAAAADPSPLMPIQESAPVASAPFAWPAPAAAPPAEADRRPVEPFVWPTPEPATDTDWIEPVAQVESPSVRHGPEQPAWANDPLDGSAELAPPWIRSHQAAEPPPAPWAAQDYIAPEESFPPLAPLVRPAAPQPAPVYDSAPAWPDRPYTADPLAHLPAAAAPPLSAWPQPIQQPAAAPLAPPAAMPAPAPAATPYSAPAPAATPYSAPAPSAQPFAARADSVALAPAAPAVIPPPAPRHVSYDAPVQVASAAAAPSLSATDRSDLWFLSTEPDTATVESEDAFPGATKEPSPIVTAILTIGMAVLVIGLVFVFIQLMTSLL